METSIMHLFIHSSGRPDNQTTLKFLTAYPRERINLVVQAKETQRYEKWANCATILILPPEIITLSPTRQRIAEYARRRGIDKFCLLDDDLRFNCRGVPSSNVKKTDFTLWVATPKQTVDCLNMLEKWLDQFAHVSVSCRQGNNRCAGEWRQPGRAMQVLGYRTDVFFDVGVDFSKIRTKQDFAATLTLLTAGYPNRVSYKYSVGQAGRSGAGANSSKRVDANPGGCSVYRTLNMMNECAYELAAMFPDFVKVVEKTTKTSFFMGTRKDVVCYWQKAYQSATVKYPDLRLYADGPKTGAAAGRRVV
jgi:hypothetical protein